MAFLGREWRGLGYPNTLGAWSVWARRSKKPMFKLSKFFRYGGLT